MLKGWLGSKSRARRVSLDLHYNPRRSVWSEIRVRSHLIVAAVGSAALLGLAGTAIWMVLPAETGREILSGVESVPRVAAAVAAPAPQETLTRPDTREKPAGATGPASTSAESTVPEAVRTAAAAQETHAAEASQPEEPEPLDPSDPRWVDKAAKQAASRTGPTAGPVNPTPVPGSNLVAAYTDEGAAADEAATAAIPSAKPEEPSSKADDEESGKAEGRASRAVRAVTMRAKPSSRGSPLGTVPAKAEVKVVSCDKWCEIVYKGKRGFVYRRFLQNNGR